MNIIRYHDGTAFRVFLAKREYKWTHLVCFNANGIKSQRFLTSDVDRWGRELGVTPSDFAKKTLTAARRGCVSVTQGALEQLLQTREAA